MDDVETLPPYLTVTRESLHRLAEHVLSAARHAQTGRIGLRPRAGGLATPPFGADERVVAVEGGELVVISGAQTRRAPVTTLRAAGEFVGVHPGGPAEVYQLSTPCDLDAPLTLDPAAMQVLADWYDVGAVALQQFAARFAADEPSEAQLWPEHLDLAISAGSVNYGVSPGDAAIDEPYAYVGPHGGAPTRDDFWNAPFGAARTSTELPGAGGVLDFFVTGRSRSAGG
ncbi:MAG: hypothetical protein QOG49_919 [Frankiaceae bacterium]|nr:hypothetical protein [Frankiaceae bacterium]